MSGCAAVLLAMAQVALAGQRHAAAPCACSGVGDPAGWGAKCGVWGEGDAHWCYVAQGSCATASKLDTGREWNYCSIAGLPKPTKPTPSPVEQEAQLERVARGRSLAPSRRLSSALARVDGGGWWSYVQGFSDICAGGTARVSNRMICAPLSAPGECTEARERSECGEHARENREKIERKKVITVRIFSLTFRVSRRRRDD